MVKHHIETFTLIHQVAELLVSIFNWERGGYKIVGGQVKICPYKRKGGGGGGEGSSHAEGGGEETVLG